MLDSQGLHLSRTAGIAIQALPKPLRATIPVGPRPGKQRSRPFCSPNPPSTIRNGDRKSIALLLKALRHAHRARCRNRFRPSPRRTMKERRSRPVWDSCRVPKHTHPKRIPSRPPVKDSPVATEGIKPITLMPFRSFTTFVGLVRTPQTTCPSQMRRPMKRIYIRNVHIACCARMGQNVAAAQYDVEWDRIAHPLSGRPG